MLVNIEDIEVRVLFVPLNLGISHNSSFNSSTYSGDTNDKDINVKHWILIFKIDGNYKCIEVIGGDMDTKITKYRQYTTCDDLIYDSSYCLGIYRGYEQDVNDVMNNHFTIGKIYDAEYNNCQHYVARFLTDLEVKIKIGDGRKFIKCSEHYNIVIDVLEFKDKKIINKMNKAYGKVVNGTMLGGVALGGVGVFGSYVNFTTTTYTGIFGYFGWPTTIVAPFLGEAAVITGPIGLLIASVGTIGFMAYNVQKHNIKLIKEQMYATDDLR